MLTAKKRARYFARPFSLQIGLPGLATIVVAMIAMVLVAVAMIFVVPMAFMHLPATVIMVVVRMTPVGSLIGRPLPPPRDPDIPPAAWSPVAIHPGVAFSRHDRSYLIADWRGRGADIDLDLAECRSCQGRCGDESA